MCAHLCHAHSPSHVPFCSILPSPSYVAHYPIPLAKEQPPEKWLRLPHFLSVLFELGIVSCLPMGKHVICKHSIMPVAASKEFKVHSNDVHAPGILFGEGWLRMEVSMPVVLGPEDDVGQGGKHIHHTLPVTSHTSCWQPVMSR